MKSAPEKHLNHHDHVLSVGSYLVVGYNRAGREIHSWEIGRNEKEALLQMMVRNAHSHQKS